jgi:hypothetical protein
LTPWFQEHNLNVSESTFATMQTLLMFVGYPRSAHSLVGAILDAHPHMAIAHEFNLLSKFERFATPYALAEALFFNAERNDLTEGGRTQSGYSYVINGAWQGAVKAPLLVLGDKKGHGTTAYFQTDFDDAVARVRRIQQLFHTEIRFVHVLRNPYDNIATMIFYEHFVNSSSWKQMRIDAQMAPMAWQKAFDATVHQFIAIALANQRLERFLIDCDANFNERCVPRARLLHIDGADLIREPIESMRRWCTFLNVPFNQQWADASRKLLFAEPFPSRNLLVWPRSIVAAVREQLKSFSPFAALVENAPVHVTDG